LMKPTVLVPDAEIARKFAYYFGRLKSNANPNMQRLQKAFRAAGIEVLYTTIESLTGDGRDRSLDYKITGFHVPKGSWDGKVIDEIAPADDEIVLPKIGTNNRRLFISSNLESP
jgi:ureidoacrylate peracid hydrolase